MSFLKTDERFKPKTYEQENTKNVLCSISLAVGIAIIIILLILIVTNQTAGDTSITLDTSDFSCGIPNPCQINTKKSNGYCSTPLNKKEGNPCKSACVTEGVCTYDYSKSYVNGNPYIFCNATDTSKCRGFCNTSADCPLPYFVYGLPPTGVACIKSTYQDSIGTCYYAQKYAQFYRSESTTVNWFIGIPSRSVSDNLLQNNVCEYILLNPRKYEYNLNDPDPGYCKECLKYENAYDFGYYTNYCLYQYECTRPDFLGTSINFLQGGALTINWGLYSYGVNKTIIYVANSNNTMSFSNFSEFLDIFFTYLT